MSSFLPCITPKYSSTKQKAVTIKMKVNWIGTGMVEFWNMGIMGSGIMQCWGNS
jgi:hypothetical protein